MAFDVINALKAGDRERKRKSIEHNRAEDRAQDRKKKHQARRKKKKALKNFLLGNRQPKSSLPARTE